MFVKLGNYLLKKDEISYVFVGESPQWAVGRSFGSGPEPVTTEKEYVVFVASDQSETTHGVFKTTDYDKALQVLDDIKHELNNATHS